MNFTTFNIKTNFSSIDRFVKNIALKHTSNHQDISLALFEMLANVVEHRFCKHFKSEIYNGKHSAKIDSMSIWYAQQKNKFELIVAYPNRPIKKSTSELGGNGKKIIKYLCESYHCEVIGKIVYEKISFDLR